MYLKKIGLPTLALIAILISCSDNKSSSETTSQTSDTSVNITVQGEDVSYMSGSDSMNSYIAYNAASQEKRPVVLIIPEWWGLGDYVIGRAKQLAELGYLAIAVDMYGNRMYAADPAKAQQLATPFYKDFSLGKARIDAALNYIKANPMADTNRIAAIGYCFGGAQVLNIARMGVNLNGVVSFHGDLVGVTPEKGKTLAKILVLHGEADQFVDSNQVNTFKKQMDSVGVDYVFKSYPNATHAFTNPQATEVGKKFQMPIEYNAAADSASWNEMKLFFGRIF